MRNYTKNYIDGQWVDSSGSRVHEVVDPATEEVIGSVALGGAVDVDRAVTAAYRAFATYSRTSREERMALLKRICAEYERRSPELAEAVIASGTDLFDPTVPFGGHKKSGNGREWGEYGFEAFLEPVSLVGYHPAPVTP
ncbi:aldehyde dehydrogenase family protein [Mycobacterium sp. AZCC_0083]|uniref:aldehyde dehydrogenase family protein n=1 Tax=Mycobacterium sp. AZCC_0083 TaxID=2735882 RepID=UPI00161BD966|nr:aldehyde dehydrogenase family protein [Mycobacterium sp. AZCC_0083]